MAKNSAQAQTEKPEAQKGSATKMPLFSTKFDGSGSDNTDEFRRTLIGHLELQGVAATYTERRSMSSTVIRPPRGDSPREVQSSLVE